MKKIVMVLIVMAVMIATAEACVMYKAFDSSRKDKKSRTEDVSAEVTTRDFKITDFSGVEVKGNMEVLYSRTGSASMSVVGPKFALDNMEVKLSDGKIAISFTSEYYDIINNQGFSWKKLVGKDENGKVKVILTSSSALREVSTSLSADFKADNIITDGDLNLSAATSADIKIRTISCRKLVATASTSADIKVSLVKADNADLNAQTSADIKFDLLTTDFLTANSQTSADLDINSLTAQKVEATASTSADIKLAGTAKEVILKASTSADIKAGKLAAEVATVSASTSGNIKYNAPQTLTTSDGVTNTYHN